MKNSKTPRGERIHISFLGHTNSGKSSLMNAIIGQNISIVSSQPGTTTDPVRKNFELLDAGSVVFIDTARFGDASSLGDARIGATLKAIESTDLAVIIQYDKQSLANFIETLTEYINTEKEEQTLIGDCLPYGSRIMLVIPIDSKAPKGRIINPQVQVIRDALDHGFKITVVRDTELLCLERLNFAVDLVITDSQAFSHINQIVPEHIALTSFSILFARYKGNLSHFVEGILALSSLKPHHRIAIAESCSHNISCEDIGRFKIPNALNNLLGFMPEIDFLMGNDFPDSIGKYSLVIHCGACMTNRQTILSRENICIKNNIYHKLRYFLAYSAGILKRSIKFFTKKAPALRNLYNHL
ncbi:[FeFe] hydrogenase H-cluster maturation GTPase HydF [Brevinema andersonii]|uniref:[FeFe] hydrogenase H-cluster maturation GTPase HydF n=1 Tax=Brevinema andersonii TaxID=34097 RepID=A0A1I1CY72_BREAD|nr:GTPase [Brevinema andersonii]SFB66996.1 [FeFe] hydrogenase H-cluster maturation GTPase HydF [Brevinema andersonii]